MASTQASHSRLGIQHHQTLFSIRRRWHQWRERIRDSQQSFPIPNLCPEHLARLIRAEWLVISLLFSWSGFLFLSALN